LHQMKKNVEQKQKNGKLKSLGKMISNML